MEDLNRPKPHGVPLRVCDEWDPGSTFLRHPDPPSRLETNPRQSCQHDIVSQLLLVMERFISSSTLLEAIDDDDVVTMGLLCK